MTLFVKEPNWKPLIDVVSKEHFKLLLIVGPSQSGKTTLLREIGSVYGFAHINLGEELSRRMVVRPIRHRDSEADDIASEIIEQANANKITIDNTEILFEHPIQMDPIKFLRNLSVHRTIIATINGVANKREIIYYVDDHPSTCKFTFTEQVAFRILQTPAE